MSQIEEKIKSKKISSLVTSAVDILGATLNGTKDEKDNNGKKDEKENDEKNNKKEKIDASKRKEETQKSLYLPKSRVFV